MIPIRDCLPRDSASNTEQNKSEESEEEHDSETTNGEESAEEGDEATSSPSMTPWSTLQSVDLR